MCPLFQRTALIGPLFQRTALIGCLFQGDSPDWRGGGSSYSPSAAHYRSLCLLLLVSIV